MRSIVFLLFSAAILFGCADSASDPVIFKGAAVLDSVKIAPGRIQFLPSDGAKDSVVMVQITAYSSMSTEIPTAVFASIRSSKRDSILLFPQQAQQEQPGIWKLTAPVKLRTTNRDELEIDCIPIAGGYAPVQSWRVRLAVEADRGSPPSFTSITFPDTVSKPATGSILVSFKAQVFDPDGLSNIDRVEFFINDVNNEPVSGSQQLFDNGSSSSGDQLAGDGIFTRTLQISATNTSRTLKLLFYASDRSGNRTGPVERRFTIQDP